MAFLQKKACHVALTNRSYYLINEGQNDLESPFTQSLFSGNSSNEPTELNWCENGTTFKNQVRLASKWDHNQVPLALLSQAICSAVALYKGKNRPPEDCHVSRLWPCVPVIHHDRSLPSANASQQSYAAANGGTNTVMLQKFLGTEDTSWNLASIL